jgi:hypothetical protein
LVELLFALAICASLLTATAVAVDAAFRAYHVKQEQAVLLGKARVSRASMTTSIRGTKLHAPNDATLRAKFALGQMVTDSGLVMYDPNDQLLKYQFDSATKRLLVTIPTGAFTLARVVEAFAVTLEPMRSAELIKTGGGWDLLRRATMTLTVKAAGAAPGEVTGQQTITLSGSVMPRRNAW